MVWHGEAPRKGKQCPKVALILTQQRQIAF
jgi:hypothetical protein